MAHGARGTPNVDMTTAAIDSVAAVRDVIADAARARTTLRIAGCGTWLDAGRPVQAAQMLSTRDLTGITGYVPGDLTLTAMAGTTLAEIRAATAANDQWLALDPYGSDDGTIGATVATGSWGPLVTSFGRPRDLVLGIEFVTGAGVVARGGGRVVKNVAGFDITRLFTGAWGTLGVITEVTVRLHAKPEADESVAISLDERATPAAERARQLLRRLPFVPYVCEVVNATLARQLGVGNGVTVLARIGGNRDALRAQRAALNELGDARDIDPAVWIAMRGMEPSGANVLRLSRLPSEIGTTWSDAVGLGGGDALIHATPSRGIVRCVVPHGDVAARARFHDALAAPSTATRIGERLDDELWALLSRRAESSALSARIRATFDPYDILNPGILGVMHEEA
ncbi:MAG: FAD-binding oxidoreductase [Gemmatimonadaceae bacterium]